MFGRGGGALFWSGVGPIVAHRVFAEFLCEVSVLAWVALKPGGSAIGTLHVATHFWDHVGWYLVLRPAIWANNPHLDTPGPVTHRTFP